MKTFDPCFRGEHVRMLPAVIVFLVVMILPCLSARAQVSINTTGNAPHSSAMLDITATGKGFLAPRMTYAQLPLSPATGLLVYVTDVTPGYYYWEGSAWKRIGLQLEQPWLFNGANIYFTAGKVSVGTNNAESHGLNVKNNINGKAAIRGTDGITSIYAEGQLGVQNYPSVITLPITVNNIGVLGIKPALGYYGAAVYGWNCDINNYNYAGLFVADGPATTQGTNYGVYGLATKAYNNFAGYFIADRPTSSMNFGVYSRADSGYSNYSIAGICHHGTYNYGLYSYAYKGGSTNYGVWSYAYNAPENYGIYSQSVWGTNNYGLYSYVNYGTTNYAGYFTGRVSIMGNSTSDAADYLSTVLTAKVMHTQYSDTRAIEAYSKPADGWGIGVYAESGYMGMRGIANAGTYTGWAYGVYGSASGSVTGGNRVGVYGVASGSGSNYAVFGDAYSGTANWAGYFNGSTYAGELRVGTTQHATGYIVSVNGKIACTEVLVQSPTLWPDYVFSKDYRLTHLDDLDQQIREKGHLPGMPSAAEAERDGVSVGEMQKKLLEKVEELTLYVIRQNQQIGKMQAEIDALKGGKK